MALYKLWHSVDGKLQFIKSDETYKHIGNLINKKYYQKLK